MFSNVKDVNKKQDFLGKTQNARQSRAEEKKREQGAIKIQAIIRQFICFRRLRRTIWSNFDALVVDPNKKDEVKRKIPALSIFKVANELLFICKGGDKQSIKRFQLLCKVILLNLETEKDAKPNMHQDAKAATVYLSMIVVFTDCKGWKILQMKGGENIKVAMQQLCANVLNDLVSKGLYSSLQDFLCNGLARTNIALNQTLLTAATSMSFRPLEVSAFSKGPLIVFVLHILSIPAIVLHLQSISEEGLKMFLDNGIFYKSIEALSVNQDMRIVFNSLEGNRALCLLGNIINLAHLEIKTAEKRVMDFRNLLVEVILGILKHCQTYVVKKQSNLTKWHPVLGWFMQADDTSWISDTMVHVNSQLRLLWKRQMVDILFASLPNVAVEPSTPYPIQSINQKKSSEKGLLRRAFGRSVKSMQKSGYRDLKDPVVLDVCQICEMYQVLAATLTQLRMEIFSALSLSEQIMVRLWKFLYSLGPDGGLKAILSYVTGGSDSLPDSLDALLTLFCDCCSQLLPIVDDGEFYEQQKPFTIEESIRMSSFLNSLVFKMIWTRESDEVKTKNEKASASKAALKDSAFMNSALTLLLLLYDRDCRRAFMPPGHWIIKEIKTRHFLADLDAEKKRAMVVLKKIPHVIPHNVRVQIFRKWIESDKESLGIYKDLSRPTALLTISRNRLLEDGYEQLSKLDGQSLKGIVRVKFVNEQGLDEAGIDQDGVFKEYLEDTIAKAFDPQLNLFKMTEEQKLYPSPTSFIHEDHLHLFEFIGKMLGKAVYEGILVDVPFAPFFLSQLLHRQHGALYSSIDELPSLDQEMYKSLCFIKNYDGDVSDLELTFSFDEDVLGKVVTHDLKPGGRVINVTNINKLLYIHLMAKFRMYTHIKDLTAAFSRGFRSIVNLEWLSIFSPPEFQRLISGDTGVIDFVDLKGCTLYYGGYHPGHPVILWLWDVLQNDFSEVEKKQFLKFVTSCSNPPLLGFKHLEPPFSIRYVECADDEDSGDSLGSVVRGFLGIRRRGQDASGRLPTASTCFNLLKLPNYRKKAILREKLRYAITSGAGFELS
eukprot:gene15545-6809_t